MVVLIDVRPGKNYLEILSKLFKQYFKPKPGAWVDLLFPEPVTHHYLQ